MTAAEFFEAIGKVSGLLFVVSSMLAMGLEPDRADDPAAAQERAAGDPGAAGQLRAGAAAGLPHHPDHSARAIAQDRPGRVGDGRGRALPAQVGAGRQGERRLWRRPDGAADGGDHHLHAARAAAAADGRVGQSVGHRQVADRADARAAGARPADQIALARHRGPLAAGDGQDLQPGHPRPARGGAGAERLQYHRPDRHGRSPGAAALHRRVAADRPPAGRPRCRATAA